jgi:hypothetical protein
MSFFVLDVSELAATRTHLQAGIDASIRAVADARQQLDRAISAWSAEVARRRAILERMDRDDPGRAEAERALDQALSELQRIRSEGQQLLQQAISRQRELNGVAEGGIAHVAAMTGHLARLPGSISTSPGSPTTTGFVADMDFDDDPILDWKDDPSDYDWLVGRFDDTVRPGVEAGMSRDDFAALDGGKDDRRRLAPVYDTMYGDRSPVRVSGGGSGGAMKIEAGRHRVDAARRLGVTSLPIRRM